MMNLLNCNHLARIRSLSSELWSAIGTEDNIFTNAAILFRFENPTGLRMYTLQKNSHHGEENQGCWHSHGMKPLDDENLGRKDSLRRI